MEGWIKLHRSISDHWIWQDPRKLKWWLDILIEVNHKSNKVNIGNRLVTCKRGQTVRSLQGWSERWGVSRETVRKFFRLLQNDKMIEVKPLSFTTQITVCNYNRYNDTVDTCETVGRHLVDTCETLGDTNKNDKNDKNDKNEKKKIDVPSGFENIWTGWKEYRSEIRKPYKTVQGEQNKITELINLSGGDPLLAGRIVQQSIDNEWTGLFPLKNNIVKINGNGINQSNHRQVNQFWDRNAPSRRIN